MNHKTRMLNLLIYLLLLPLAVHADDDLRRPASWTTSEINVVQQQVTQWLTNQALDEPTRNEALDLWSATPTTAEIFPRTVATLEIADVNAANLIAYCRANSSIISPPDIAWLSDENQSEFARNNMRLYFGKWCAIHQMYNEALEMLEPMTTDDVVDPASLLFYQAASHYRLREKEKGSELLEKLLENKPLIPRRYATVAELMLADLENFKPDTLDEVSRLMDSVRVRLGLGRAGKRVRSEEDEVVEKLEQMIEELEKKRQQQQQQQQTSGKAGGPRSDSPASDSMLPNMQASGDVDKKRLDEEADWGNLPPKERQEALQALGKEFPSHYREVIEEYFRKLARDDDQPK